MDGLKRGHVRVVEHDGKWAEEAEQCIALLKGILGNDMVDAQHVGSTAIQGICAKPIIDIAVGVKCFPDILKHNEELSNHGIFYRKQEHGAQLLYVCGDLDNDTRTHHVHVVEWDSQAWHDYLDFRDYLNCHGQEAKAYSELKEELAKWFPEDRNAYTSGKQEFINSILQKAAQWRKSVQEADSN